MSNLSYVVIELLCQVLSSVPLGTKRGLFVLLWALLSGRFLRSRGAVISALSALGISDQEARRSQAALTYGRFRTSKLVQSWKHRVSQDGHWRQHCYEGVRPVACDLVGFYRPHLMQCRTKHYSSQA